MQGAEFIIHEAERTRLLQFCIHLTHNKDVAEDLVQETLFEAWRQQHKLYKYEGQSAWLHAIARNMYLRWRRTQSQHLQHISNANTQDNRTSMEEITDHFDLEMELEHQDLVRLLDQALALLEPNVRDLLIERYVKNTSLWELAERLGVQPNTAAKRLERGRIRFQNIINQHFAEDLLPYVVTDTHNQWKETYLWCPLCGQHRIQARSSQTTELEMRCPGCYQRLAGSLIEYSSHDLKTLKGYGRALDRSFHWLETQIIAHLPTGNMPCPNCGRMLHIQFGNKESLPFSDIRQGFHDYLFQQCLCGYANHNPREGLALTLPEGRRFWKIHKRIHLCPTKEIEFAGRACVLTTFKTIDDQHTLACISDRDTFRILEMSIY